MKTSGLLFLLPILLVAACSSAKKREANLPEENTNYQNLDPKAVEIDYKKIVEDATKEKTAIEVVRTQIHPKTVIPGKKYVIYNSSSKTSLSEASLQKVYSKVRKLMKSLGYTEVKNHNKAYVMVVLSSGYRNKGTSTTYTTTKVEKNGEVIQDDKAKKSHKVLKDSYFYIGFLVNSYGKRPKDISKAYFYSPKPEWTGYEDKLLSLVDKELPKFIKKAPTRNTVGKGEPGCSPRFGFEYDSGYKIKEILKNSPAAKAGLKVGDKVIAIDSHPMPYQVASDVYEKFIEVPVKLQRGKKMIRTKIKSKIMCNY